MMKGRSPAALVAVAVAIAGCGGSSSSDQTAKFKKSYAAVSNHLRQTSQAIGSAIQQAPGQTDAQLATTFHGLASRWQSQVSELETLHPPSNLQTVFNTLTSAATRTESDLTAIASAAETHGVAAAKQASASLVTDILAAKAASTTITNKLGIK
jgi:hypothetical protein